MPAPVADRTTVPPPPPAVAEDPGASRPVLTPRGTAACRLSEFRDAWAEFTPADRAWFAEDLRDLLVDAVLGEPAPTA